MIPAAERISGRTHLTLSEAQRRHCLRETALSILINAIFSALFVWLMFGGRSQLNLWGSTGLALDFVPQTFVITLMATLVPSAVTRKKRRDGKLPRLARPVSKLPYNLIARALLLAAVVTPAAVALVVLLLASLWTGPMPLAVVLMLKVSYGSLLALAVTSFAVRDALSDALPQ